MSSDGKEPEAIWQGPTSANRRQSSDLAPPPDVEELPPLPPQQQRGVPIHDIPLPEDEEEASGAEPAATPRDFLKQLVQYFTLVLAPLLFGALTCLFVLPLVAEGRASLPPEGFWPITLVIIAITIAQGVAVYYAGSNQSLWILATIGGFCLFLMIGCFAIFGLVPGLVLFAALLAIAVALARRCFHPVPEGFVDIIFSFGKYSRTIYQGFNLLLPWEKVAYQLNVEETQWMCPAQRVQLSRDEDVILRAVISYQMVPEDAYLAVTQVNSWEESLRQLFIITLQNIVCSLTPDDFLLWPHGLHAQSHPHRQSAGDPGQSARREQINDALFQQVRDKVALWGIQLNWVHIQDIELVPHGASTIDLHAPVTPVEERSQQQTTQPAQHMPSPATLSQSSPAAQPAPDKHAVPKQEPPPQTPMHDTSGKILKEEVLKKAYYEVKNGNITDPETIRSIAASFDAVARDPRANQSVSFDAARAALNLYDQARKYDEQYRLETPYNDATRPDWTTRRATDENLMAGG